MLIGLIFLNGPKTTLKKALLWYARIQKVLSDRVYLWRFYFCWWGEERGSKYHYKRAIISQPAKRHLNGISLACRWWPNMECLLGSLLIFQGIRTSLLRNALIFLWFFKGWVPDPLPLDPPIKKNSDRYRSTCKGNTLHVFYSCSSDR